MELSGVHRMVWDDPVFQIVEAVGARKTRVFSASFLTTAIV
jgi:hypothetical protein